jgi:hypothetical protein
MAGVTCPHCHRETRVHREMDYTGFIRKCGLCNKALPDEAPKPAPKPVPLPSVPALTPAQALTPPPAGWAPTAEERTASAVAAVVAAPARAVVRDAPSDASDIVASLSAELDAVERELARVEPLRERRAMLKRMIAAASKQDGRRRKG